MVQHAGILLIPLIHLINRTFSFHVRRAVVWLMSAAAFALAGCGQRGPLYLPDTPAARQRATLPDALWPAASDDASDQPATPTP